MTYAPEAEEYELVVVGTLGPVLRCALAPYASATPEVCAVVRASGDSSDNGARDLVDVLILLEARGLEISSIQRLP